MIQKFCRQSGSLSLKTFRTVWNISILSGRYPYCAKLSRHSVKFRDDNNWKLSCVFVWNQSRHSGKSSKQILKYKAVGQKYVLISKTFRARKNFPESIARALARYFCLCVRGSASVWKVCPPSERPRHLVRSPVFLWEARPFCERPGLLVRLPSVRGLATVRGPASLWDAWPPCERLGFPVRGQAFLW